MNNYKIENEILKENYRRKYDNKFKETCQKMKNDAEIYSNKLENERIENKIKLGNNFTLKNEQLKNEHIENMEKLKVENQKNELDYMKK